MIDERNLGKDKSKLIAISYQLSAISFQLSAISYQLSAISYQLSAISYQLSAISYQRLALRARYANSFQFMRYAHATRTAFSY